MSLTTANAVLERWNALEARDAAREVIPCCGSSVWAKELVEHRPLRSVEEMLAAADAVWHGLPEHEWHTAFDSHPRIGQQHARIATAESLAWSLEEQSTAMTADEPLKAALAIANRRYEEKFGRIFIVCAAGRPSTEILTTLERRMENSPETELMEAAEQQRQITRLRLRRWLGVDYAMGISTHILDMAAGRPATDVPVSLERREGTEWHTLNSECTDADGRCHQLLPSELVLEPGLYRIHFDTALHFRRARVTGLYPYVEITFEVSDREQHYHIPLLLTANGYTTYRGS